MEDPKQRSKDGHHMRDRLRQFLRRGGADRGSQRQTRWSSYAQAGLVLVAVMLTEVHMVLPDTFDNERKWLIYLALSEVAKAIICLVAMAWAPIRMKPTALMGAVWYSTQAQQEFTGSNIGSTETWEYWLVAAMAVAVIIQLRLKA